MIKIGLVYEYAIFCIEYNGGFYFFSRKADDVEGNTWNSSMPDGSSAKRNHSVGVWKELVAYLRTHNEALAAEVDDPELFEEWEEEEAKGRPDFCTFVSTQQQKAEICDYIKSQEGILEITISGPEIVLPEIEMPEAHAPEEAVH